MHQSMKEIIVLKAQNEILQNNFQESLAAAPLLASDELIMLAVCKSSPVMRSVQNPTYTLKS
jgi:hypothetical protein